MSEGKKRGAAFLNASAPREEKRQLDLVLKKRER